MKTFESDVGNILKEFERNVIKDFLLEHLCSNFVLVIFYVRCDYYPLLNFFNLTETDFQITLSIIK